jgi:hypothetical protein
LRRTHVLCDRLKIKSGYNDFKAGKAWFEGLKRRFPGLVLRKPEELSSVRARMFNPEVLGKYFDTLESVVAAINLLDKSQYIWNCDKSGFYMEHNPVKIYAEKGEKSVASRTSNKSSNITLMACVNGAGDRMSPMFINKSKT